MAPILIRLGRIGMFLSFHALFGEIITKSLPDKIHETQVGAQVVGVKHDKETQASRGARWRRQRRDRRG